MALSTTPGLCRCCLGRSPTSYNRDETITVFSKWLCKEDCKGKGDPLYFYVQLYENFPSISFLLPLLLFFLPRDPLDLYITKRIVHGTFLLILSLPEMEWHVALNHD